VRAGREGGRGLQLALFGAGLVLFNFPMLIVWDRPVTVLGLPLLPVALFAVWAGLIGLLAWASERTPQGLGPADEHGRQKGEPAGAHSVHGGYPIDSE
jgi:hypothetical protein